MRTILVELGGEPGCRRIAQDFYSRVAFSSELKPLFPGKSLRCATEEFAAFLIQFLGGDPDQTQYRWWLSLRQSHARFRITEEQRITWLGLMHETIDSFTKDSLTRKALEQFFEVASTYVIGNEQGEIDHPELADRWSQQRRLDELVDHLSNKRDREAIILAIEYLNRPSLMSGILAKMMEEGRTQLIDFVLSTILDNETLAKCRFSGRTLLHYAAGTSCLPVVKQLVSLGVDPNIEDSGGHSPLYRAARTKQSQVGASIITELVQAGADVNHCGGVNRSTALHQAARFGDVGVAATLIHVGANVRLRDKNGLTPLDRAIRCRRTEVAEILASAL